MEFSNLNIGNKDHDVLDAIKCRQIIKEILDFGVNQNQIETLIKFLALELENRELMLSIRKIFEESDNLNIENKPSIEI